MTIIETEPAARKALEKVLKKEGLEGLCAVSATAGNGPVIRLLETGKGIAGANDFTKPVRAGAVVQQVRRFMAGQNDAEKLISFGTYTLNGLSHELVNNVSGEMTRLTEKESHILKLLAQNPGMTVSRKTMLEQVWNYADGIETHTLETHIYRLRQKIEQDPTNPALLITEEAGYRLN